MQTDTLKIDGYEALFTMFTTLPPELQRRVLPAIADPKIEIGHDWGDCLFAVATRAANRSLIKNILSIQVNATVAANALGIPIEWVNQGVKVWDNDSGDERKAANEAFRNRIRKHLAELEEPVAVQAPLSV